MTVPKGYDDDEDADHQRQPAGHAALCQAAGHRQDSDGDDQRQQDRVDDGSREANPNKMTKIVAPRRQINNQPMSIFFPYRSLPEKFGGVPDLRFKRLPARILLRRW